MIRTRDMCENEKYSDLQICLVLCDDSEYVKIKQRSGKLRFFSKSVRFPAECRDDR